ncbi:hypothetical protein ACFVYP_14745 [Kitasatospora sp. NPDC058201]|uniref:hypothetical protein n=1 Tax=unclassified Kitasatospora TaxID=2633591 RepID=UPI003660CE32
MATRWDEWKLDTYVQYATCVKEIAALAKRAVDAEAGSTARAEFLAAMDQAEIKRSALLETLVLLASLAAVEAAKVVNAALWESEIAAREHTGVPNGPALVELLNAYHSQARPRPRPRPRQPGWRSVIRNTEGLGPGSGDAARTRPFRWSLRWVDRGPSRP